MGICGTAMASLAIRLKKLGYKITGSDTGIYPPMSDKLSEAGIGLMEGFKKENLLHNPDLVVVGNVMTADHEESKALLKSNILYTSFAKLISDTFMNTQNIVIAGTHGKTSTTALMSWMLCSSGNSVDFFIGGVCNNFSDQLSCSFENKDFFVIEGDEYDTAFFDKQPKFMHYKPNHLILTSIELDHLDIYSDLDDIKQAFISCLKIKKDGFVVAYASENVLSVLDAANINAVTYGFKNADYIISDICDKDQGVEFCIKSRNINDRIRINMFGKHNILNAVGVYILSKKLGLSTNLIQKAFLSFKGVKRRSEIIGVKQNITIVDDFAHHPTAVKSTIDAFQKRCEGKVISVFEPRSFTSRGSTFQKEYADAFKSSQFCIICDVTKKSNDINLLDTQLLVDDIKNFRDKPTYRAKNVENALSIITKNVCSGDVVLIMSNGSFDNIHKRLLDRL